MKISVDTSAFDVEGCIAELQRRLIMGVTRACQDMEDEAVARCPQGDHEGADTVSLAQSITTQITDNGGKIDGVVGSGLDYAVYVHEGTGIRSRTGMGRTHDLPWSYQDDMGNWHTTSGMESRPSLEEAFNAKRDRAEKIIQEAVRNG